MKKKIIVGLFLAAGIFLFIYFDLASLLSLQSVKAQQDHFKHEYQNQPWLYTLGFFAIYVLITALSIPGATALTLLAGSLFGFGLGSLLVSFASSLGATLAFLGARYLLRDQVTQRFSSFFKNINSGVEKDGAFYLLSLRLIPAIPFFIVNLGLGLTQMRTSVFYFVSQLGMIPGTLAYVNAGTQLAKIESLRDVLSRPVLISFALLGLLPLILRLFTTLFASQKIYHRYQKPKSFDYNIVAIGGGAAGLVTSYISAAAKAKVALIEKHKMGGDCLNTGCIPSKSLIRTAQFLSDAHKCQALGIDQVNVQFDFKNVMNRVQKVIQTIAPHDSVERYTQLGVDCYQGNALIRSPWEVEVNGKILTTKNIVIATGARPTLPPLPGLEDVHPLTSENIWSLEKLPQNLLVLGGGAIGLELAQAFQRLGSQVTLVERSSTLLSREDHEVSEWLTKKLTSEGLRVLTSTTVEAFHSVDGKKVAVAKDTNQQTSELVFDEVLVALGRSANVKGFGLEDLQVELTEQKAIKVNSKLQTNYPNIFACGDVTGLYQFTHTAAHQAWFTSINALLRPFYSLNVDESVIPWCIYTDPEVARVGLNEKQVLEQNIPHQVTFFNTDHLDRALTEEKAYGFIKIITESDSDQILGVTLVGHHAGECLAEFVLAIKHGLGLNKILQTIHVYPTLTEANKMAAGQWRKTKVSPRLLKLSESFNKWRRS